MEDDHPCFRVFSVTGDSETKWSCLSSATYRFFFRKFLLFLVYAESVSSMYVMPTTRETLLYLTDFSEEGGLVLSNIE